MVTFNQYTFTGAHATQKLSSGGMGGRKHRKSGTVLPTCHKDAENRNWRGGMGDSEKETQSTPSEVALHSNPISSSWNAHHATGTLCPQRAGAGAVGKGKREGKRSTGSGWTLPYSWFHCIWKHCQWVCEPGFERLVMKGTGDLGFNRVPGTSGLWGWNQHVWKDKTNKCTCGNKWIVFLLAGMVSSVLNWIFYLSESFWSSWCKRSFKVL